MTPAQHALKSYFIAKMSEGVLKGITAPTQVAKKLAGEFAADLPVVTGDLLEMLGDNVATMVGRAVLDKVGDFARNVSANGVKSVISDLNMQYQRGVERNRNRKGK